MSNLRFAGKGVGIIAGRAPGAGGEGVGAGRAAKTAATRRRAMIRHGVKLRRAAFAGEINVVVPESHFAGSVHAGGDFDNGGGPEGVVEELLLTAPHDLDGLAGELGQAGGLDRFLVVGFSAEAAADKRGDDADLLRRKSNRPGNLVAHAKGILR